MGDGKGGLIMRRGSRTAAAILAVWAAAFTAAPAATSPIQPTERGAIVETERYRATIENGLLVSFLNKLTQEEYLDPQADLAAVRPHLPAGLGTQNGEAALEAADRLYRWPWKEHPANAEWPNQRFPDGKSRFECQVTGAKCLLTYGDLTDGRTRFPDETYGLALAVDAETGDLLLSPSARSPRPGVYAANVALAPLAPTLTVEAPIFDGVRLDADMPPHLYANAWGSFWDYAFVAVNGRKRGAVGIWCQDADLKRYKHFFYLVDDQGLSMAFSVMNLPPFEELKEAKSLPWRIQAFDKSWAQAAARFREWRLKSVKIAPRPDWALKVSFVNGGVNAAERWLGIMSAYLEGKNLDRTVTFAPTIRKAQFDTRHWDNSPYDTFKEDMKAWKNSGAKLMAYLQPMIMWGSPPSEPEFRKIYDIHLAANTRSVFQKKPDTVISYVDQHHLGHPEWQAWFLGCVKEYIQGCGADGVYHDQSYLCPIDRRGLAVGGKTSPQGMADYFYKAATENPGSIHGTEHMTEVNNVGASLGIGSGILWGSPHAMRHQRIRKASPVSNALHWPNGAIWAFPHYSDFPPGGATRFHWGMDLMEKRGDLAANYLQNPTLYTGGAAPFDKWRNELWLDRLRAVLFARHGLRAAFPEDWDRGVLTYFKAADGQEFRYERRPWGSAFVQGTGSAATMQYGRIRGVTHADTRGGIAGWAFHNEKGPAGLHPDRAYCLDPAAPFPAVTFAPGNWQSPDDLFESYVSEGFANERMAFLRVKAIESVGQIIHYDTIALHAPKEPQRIVVNGRAVVPTQCRGRGTTGRWKDQDQWNLSLKLPASVAVLVDDPAPGFDKLASNALVRVVEPEMNTDLFDPAWLSGLLKQTATPSGGVSISSQVLPENLLSARKVQMHVPFAPPADAKSGTLRLTLPQGAPSEVAVDGVDRPVAPGARPWVFEHPMKAGEAVILSITTPAGAPCTFEWVEAQPTP
jgi:hypothetical protein